MFGSCPIATKSPSVGISVVSPVFTFAEADRADLAVLAEHLVDDGVRDELDPWVRAGAVEHDRRGAELVAPVDDRHLVGELREEDRLLHRRVAAADDDDVLARGRRRRRRRRSTRRRAPGARCSDSSPSWRALAPVATITARARYSSSPTSIRNGRSEKSTAVTSSVMNSAPKRSAWRRKSCHHRRAQDPFRIARGSSRRRS